MTWEYGPEELWAALRTSPGAFVLIVGGASLATMEQLSSQRNTPVSDVGRLLTVEHKDGWKTPERVLQNHSLLIAMDVLFWPEVMIDPLRLLRSLASHHPVVAEWPGQIRDHRTTYSEPGRPDHYDQPLPVEAIVLRARSTTFPDELPYTVERA